MSLLRYVGARFGMYIVVLFIGLTILFVVPRLMPSDPIEGYLMRVQNQTNTIMSPEEVAAIRASLTDLYGLEGSLPQGGETVVEFPNNHLGYAITWFGFAVLTPVLLAFWIGRQLRP